MFGTMRDVYDVVRVAWRELIRVHTLSGSSQAPPHVILTQLTNVRGQHLSQGLLLLRPSARLSIVPFSVLYIFLI